MTNDNYAAAARSGIDPAWDEAMREARGDDWPDALVREHGMGCHEPAEYASVPFCEPCEERAAGEAVS